MASSFTTNIGVGDGEVEVLYDYYASDCGSYYQPPEPESCEIISVIYKGFDVTSIVDDRVMEELEEMACKDANESYQDYLNDKAENDFEARRLEQGYNCG